MTQAMSNSIRERWINMISEIVASEKYCFTDALRVGPSEVSFPVLDDDRNEIFVNVSVSIPKSKIRNGKQIPYDGYQEAEDYAAERKLK